MMGEYSVVYYRDTRGRLPVKEYIYSLEREVAEKVYKYIEYLRQHDGYLDEPYSKHIHGSIRELRVDFGKIRNRIFYFTFIGKTIILLHAFSKKTTKTPPREIEVAIKHYQDIHNNPGPYEQTY